VTHRPEILGSHHIVAGGRHYSVAAGSRIAAMGGNAFDAGVATVFAAAVVEISHFGFGGEAPTILYVAKEGRVVVINGQGPAPLDAHPGMFAAKGTVDTNGPLAATIPAVLDAMAIILRRFGTMRLEQVMGPAIELADGFPLYQFLRQHLIVHREATERWQASRATYYPEGRVPEVGEVFRQPQLAATLRAIVDAERSHFARCRDRDLAIQAGRDLFYKGELAKRIVAANRNAGGAFQEVDLADFHGTEEAAVTVSFSGYDVHKAGPWNQGPVLLQVLNILEQFDLRSMGHNSASYLHTVHEAIKLAYADRNAYYGDPRFARVPMTGLLSKEYAAVRAKLIEAKASLEHRFGDPFAFDPDVRAPNQPYRPHTQGSPPNTGSGDTTCVCVADAAGNLFSATPSSGWLLNGAFIAGDTGVPLSNRMQVFDLDPLSPNVLVGGKRPRTTLSPTVITTNGQPYLALSTPGGDNQDQQILNVLLALLVFDMDLQSALEAPRVNSLHPHLSFATHESRPGVLQVEDRIGADVFEALRGKGHVLDLVGAYGVSTGVVAAGVNPLTQTLRGGADVRRERYAFGW
jgi:gamma-glutamyltranspeptidase / glutathione hydrolase